MMETFEKHAKHLDWHSLAVETSVFEGIVARFAQRSLAKLLTYLTTIILTAEKEDTTRSIGL